MPVRLTRHAGGMPTDIALVAVLGGSLAAVVVRPTWRVVRYPVTAVHEFGHLIVAVALGGRVPRVRLWADTSGVTTWRTSQTGRLRSAVIALAGHSTPPIVGAACAGLLAADRAPWGVAGLAVLVAIVTLAVRNLWGLVVCLALGALCWWGVRDNGVAAGTVLGGAAGVLCLGGVRAVAEELTSNRPGGSHDTQVVARALPLPAGVWGALLLVWALACTAWATWRVAAIA